MTHPNSTTRLYYVSYEWAQMGNVRLYKRFENKWFDLALRSYKDPALAREVTNARFEQRLVPILAGIHWPVVGDISPTVYFIKLRPAS